MDYSRKTTTQASGASNSATRPTPPPAQQQSPSSEITAAHVKAAQEHFQKLEQYLQNDERAKDEKVSKSLVAHKEKVYQWWKSLPVGRKEKADLGILLNKIELALSYIESISRASEDDAEDEEIIMEDNRTFENEMTVEQWKNRSNPNNIKAKMLDHVQKTNDLEDLDDIAAQAQEYQEQMFARTGSKVDLSQVLNAIVTKRKTLARDPFDLPLVIRSNESENGYPLFSISDGVPIMTKEEFVNCWKLWSQEKKEGILPDEQFKETFLKDVPKTWYDVNPDGSFSEEVAKHASGSKERNDERKKVLSGNFKATLKLPYPRRVVLNLMKTQECDSVQHLNFLCEWVKRKAFQMSSAQKQQQQQPAPKVQSSVSTASNK